MVKVQVLLNRVSAVGCANPSGLPPGIWLQRDGDHALMRCNTTGETWRITCSRSQWRGQTRVNCSQSASSSSAAAFPLDGIAAWDLSQFFVHEAFPFSNYIIIINYNCIIIILIILLIPFLITIRSHCMHAMYKMQPTVTDVARTVVCMSVSVYCHSNVLCKNG